MAVFRLPENAVQFFKNAAVGTPVEISHALAPDYEPSPISEKYSNLCSMMDR